MGRGWVKNSSRTLPPLKLLHSSDLPRLSGAPTVPILWETSGLLPGDKGVSQTPQSCCLLPRPSKIHPFFSGLLGLVLRISGMEKRVSLFSLLFFSITKNYPRMSKGICPSPHSTLVPARMGWAQLKGGSSVTALFYTQLPDLGQKGAISWLLQRPLAIWVT